MYNYQRSQKKNKTLNEAGIDDTIRWKSAFSNSHIEAGEVRKRNKMEEYEYLEYLEYLNSEELIKLISEMLDFEETTQALMILEDKNSKKALELGKDIIKNNKGDDYLQATVWNIFFFDNQKDMIDVVTERTEKIGKTLLDEIVIDLTNHKVVVSNEFLKKLKNAYTSIANANKINMRCKFEKFLEYYEGANLI